MYFEQFQVYLFYNLKIFIKQFSQLDIILPHFNFLENVEYFKNVNLFCSILIMLTLILFS